MKGFALHDVKPDFEGMSMERYGARPPGFFRNPEFSMDLVSYVHRSPGNLFNTLSGRRVIERVNELCAELDVRLEYLVNEA
jgi:hypothetical protein